MSGFNPKIVDRHGLDMMRTQARRDAAYAILYAAMAAIIFIFGMPAAMGWLFTVLATGSIGIALARTRRVGLVEVEQSKTPRVWPPDHFQCCICGSYAADAIDYKGAGWREYFGYRIHDSCETWVWPLWHPERAIESRRG